MYRPDRTAADSAAVFEFPGRDETALEVIARKMEGTSQQREQDTFQECGRKPAFSLYIGGATLKSTRAITSLKPVLDDLYKQGYSLRVIDIHQGRPTPGSAEVFATPMLIREYPLPALRIGGDFSSSENIRQMLSGIDAQ